MQFESKSRLLAVAICLLVVAVVGYFDYRSGFENSMVLFYLAPIAAATWFGRITSGLFIAACSVAAWVVSDVAAGIPRIVAWNIVTGFAAYVIFVVILSLLQRALAETQARVDERTAALRRELMARKQLEKEIVAAAEHERQRVGRDLHDNLSQHLTGTSLIAQGLADKIEALDANIASDARKVVDLINRATALSREVARGLFSFELDADGLSSALHSLARSASQRYGIDCDVVQADEARVSKTVAGHLYWIANEAVSNAGKHGGPRRVSISLRDRDGRVDLEVKDDGHGLPREDGDARGIGLKVMQQRAQLAGGGLQIISVPSGGTIVACEVPASGPNIDE
jgi:signal transduction histidine kinase